MFSAEEEACTNMPDTSALRIALASPYDFAVPSGVNQHVKHLSDELRRLGHHVTIFAPLSKSDTGTPKSDFHGFGGVVPVPANGSVAHISCSLNLPRLKRLLSQERFDVMHCHEPLTPMLTLAMLRFSDIPSVGTFHAYGESSPHYVVTRPILRHFFNRIDGRVAVSELARDFASRYFGGDYRIIPNGVDTSLFESQAEPMEHLMDGRPNVLFLGRFEEDRKGFDYALKALSLVRHTFPDVRLVVVGHGNASRFTERMRRYGISQNVHFTGKVSDVDRARYMATCQFLIAPNTGSESQGMIVLEAMAAGLSVIASNITAFAGVVTHGRDGLLVEPGNEHCLAKSMVRVLSDPSNYRQMAACGRLKAAEYSWPKVADQLVEFYREIAERKAWVPKSESRSSYESLPR